MKIIVVDDEMSALQAFLGEIIGEDVEYKFYRDDAEAVCEYAAKGGVNAAFLDIRMPKTDGVELAERLLRIDPTIKIVFITGLSLMESDLPDSVRKHTLGFLYKPYETQTLLKFLSLIKDKKRVLVAKMFDTFDCFADGEKVKFSSAKSKELFALLLAYNGKTQILYRDAVWRLRRTLSDLDIPCVEWRRAALSLDKTMIECDYWHYLLTGRGDYRGEFCKTYDWSVYYLAELDGIRQRAVSETKADKI